METRKISNRTCFMPFRTILLYHRSFFMIPKVPSDWMERFIRRRAPWILLSYPQLLDAWKSVLRWGWLFYSYPSFYIVPHRDNPCSLRIGRFPLVVHIDFLWHFVDIANETPSPLDSEVCRSRQSWNWRDGRDSHGSFCRFVSFLNMGNFIYFSMPCCSQ